MRRLAEWFRTPMPLIVWLPLVLLIALGALALSVRWLEPQLAFFPTTGETETPRTFGVDYQPLTVRTDDGEVLHAWTMHARNPRARVIYFHGNGGNLSIWAPILSTLARQGYSVLAFDYRGYGLSTGRPTERGLYQDVTAIVRQGWPDSSGDNVPLVFWGRSLGATMAAYAASIRTPDGIILESGFPDVRALMQSSGVMALLLPFASYRCPTAEYLSRVAAPVLVMHGDHDGVIPYRLGQELFARLREPKTFVTIGGADHNDAPPPDPKAYWSAIDGFTTRLRP
jgi:fermentation-respiration switch protein FrsA (DUF1100 family)